jgi:chromosome segregation ATPase
MTKERLEAVNPAAASGLEQVTGLHKRCVENALKAGRTASHGWEDLGARLAANQAAMMEGVLAMTQSWLGGGALEAVEDKLTGLGERTAKDIEAVAHAAATTQRQQAEALKAATDGMAADLAAAKAATDDVAADLAAAKAVNDDVAAEAAAARTEAAVAAERLAALGATLDAKAEALRGTIAAEIAKTVERRVDEARLEIERETDEEVSEKLEALKKDFAERLKAVEDRAAGELETLRSQIAALGKAKPAAAPKRPAKTTRKPKA